MCASFPDRILKLTLLFAVLAAFSGCAAYGPTRQGEAVHRDVVYAEREGRSLHLDLYLPPRSTTPAPVVVWFHGGSWKYGDKGFSLQVRDLTRQGFAVASVQYRLIRQNRWPAQIDDATAAVDWLRANAGRYGLDGKRIGLSGESAGGHLAALVGLQKKRPSVRAVCAIYPPTDMIALGRKYASYRGASIVTQMFSGPIEERLEVARAASPLNYVSPRAPAFLFYHGDRDWLVPIEHSRWLDEALRKAGVTTELVVCEGRSHAFHLDDDQLEHVAAFFRRHL